MIHKVQVQSLAITSDKAAHAPADNARQRFIVEATEVTESSPTLNADQTAASTHELSITDLDINNVTAQTLSEHEQESLEKHPNASVDDSTQSGASLERSLSDNKENVSASILEADTKLFVSFAMDIMQTQQIVQDLAKGVILAEEKEFV